MWFTYGSQTLNIVIRDNKGIEAYEMVLEKTTVDNMEGHS